MNVSQTTTVRTIVTATDQPPSACPFVKLVSVAVSLPVRPSITTPFAVVWKDTPEIPASNVSNVKFYPINLLNIFNNKKCSYQLVAGCRSNSDCPSKEACINGQCANPCRCGVGAICEIRDHNAVCKCPSGTTGNPLTGCTCNYLFKFLISYKYS